MDMTLANQIAEFEPRDGDWLPLEEHLERAFSSADPRVYYPAIFNLFEQYPEDDGAGVFWSALHGMEAVGGYERDLLRFFRRYPTEMAKAMLFRLRNSGQECVEGVPIDLLVGKY